MNYTEHNKNIDIYFKEISKFNSMTREDEIILFARIAKGDKSAETEIFNKMSKLAVNIAKTYTGKADLLSDLIQEANYGVLKAIYKYDVNMGFRFSSFARWWMKAYIADFMRDLGMVHPTNNRYDAKVKEIREDYFRKYHREISVYDLMDALEEMGVIVTDPSALTQIVVTSIDQTREDDDFTFESSETFNNKTASRNEAEDQMDSEQLSEDLRKMMMKLDDRERQFVMWNFGIGCDFEMDYKSMTEKYNKTHTKQLTMERVRQITVGAIKKMRG